MSQKDTECSEIRSRLGHSMDSFEMNEPIALCTRRKFKLQYPSEAMKDKDILVGLQVEAEDKKLLLQLIAQSKRQQGEFIGTKLVLKKVLELQISIVQELQGEITAELRNDAQDKSDKKFKCELVKLFQPNVTLENEKAQVLINVKDVQKASNCAKRIKYLEHQIKAAQVYVLDSRPRHSIHMRKVIAKAGVESSLSQISSQHDWGSSKIIVHGSLMQNDMYPNPRSPSIDACQETEASQIYLDESTDNPRPNYARVCWSTQSKRHTETSISADESELFGAPSDSIDGIANSCKVRAKSKVSELYEGKIHSPKSTQGCSRRAQEAITAALCQVPDAIHFDQRGKRTAATLYVGNLDFKASTQDL